MKFSATLKSFVKTAVNVAAKKPLLTLAIVVIAIVVIVVIFGEKKEGMSNGGRTVRAVPSKYPHWGWDKNVGLRCKNNDNTGCTTGWKDGALVDLEPASTANLVPWPTSQIPGGPGQLLLTAYKNNILRIHSKNNKNLKTIADVEKIWGLYRNPHSGLYEILVMSADVPIKQAASAETWRRTRLMVDLVSKTTLPKKFVKKLQDFVNIPKIYGGLSPISECDSTLGSNAGALASSLAFKGGKIPHVFTLWRVPPRDVAPGETMADKRFGIIVHEMTHVICHDQNCAGLDDTGHCGDQQMVEDVLRRVCAKHGLKPPLPAKTLKFFAEKCAKFAASRN